MSNTIATQPNMLQKFVSLTGLRAYFDTLMDPRNAKGKRYQLNDLLILLILAKLGGEERVTAESNFPKLVRKPLTMLADARNIAI